MNEKRIIACFSMEIALDPDMPTYSGGLGVPAGDTIRSAADLGIPVEGVTGFTSRFIDIMLHCIALNGSFFNTHRMMQQYVPNAYFL